MTMPNLNAVAADGRFYLAHSEAALQPDRGGRLPPALHSATPDDGGDSSRWRASHLTDDGVVVINVGHTPRYALVEAMVATLRQVFPSTHVIDVRTGLTPSSSLH